MIRIIKHGHLAADKQYSTKCNQCGCEFSFQCKDAVLVPDFRDGDALKLNCPDCGTEQWVDAPREMQR